MARRAAAEPVQGLWTQRRAQCSQRRTPLAQDFRGCSLPSATCDQIFLLLLLGAWRIAATRSWDATVGRPWERGGPSALEGPGVVLDA